MKHIAGKGQSLTVLLNDELELPPKERIIAFLREENGKE